MPTQFVNLLRTSATFSETNDLLSMTCAPRSTQLSESFCGRFGAGKIEEQLMFMQLMYLNANQFDTNLTLPPSMSYFQIMHIVRKSIYFSVMS